MPEKPGTSTVDAAHVECARCHKTGPSSQMARLKDGRWLCHACVSAIRAARARRQTPEPGSLAAKALAAGKHTPGSREETPPSGAAPVSETIPLAESAGAQAQDEPDVVPCPKCGTSLIFGTPICEECGVILDDFWEEEEVRHPLNARQKMVRYGGRALALLGVAILALILWPRQGEKTIWESVLSSTFVGPGEALDEAQLGSKIHPKVTRVGRNLVIRNEDDFDWVRVKLLVNASRGRGGFMLERQRLRSGVTYEYPLVSFRQQDGQSFTATGVPITQIDIRVETPDGPAIWSKPFVDATTTTTVD